VLVAAGDRLTQVFFPHNGVISLVVSLAGGGMVEVAMVGREMSRHRSPNMTSALRCADSLSG
jgi:hypothetical protein